MIQIKISEAGLQHLEMLFEELERKLRSPYEITPRMAEMIYEAVMENFEDEASGYPMKRRWAPLALSTRKKRARYLGPARAAHPILQFTGEMKKSVAYRGGREAVVFTRDPKAIYHVMGTIKMPQRNFMEIDRNTVEDVAMAIAEWLLSEFERR